MTTTTETALAPADPGFLTTLHRIYGLVAKGYHRSQVTGMETVPDGGALLVSNHSGGLMPMDVPVLAVAFWDAFGVERPFRVLAHDVLMKGPWGDLLRSTGMISATRENAAAALAAGAVTVVFPGGDFDAYRPTSAEATVDFNGRTGYVRTALEAGVPVVPVVSLGGQETQYVLTRGQRVGRHSPLRHVMRSDLMPVTVGFPFGVTLMGLPNLPLPSKIVTRVLPAIDLAAEFGPDPDVAEVDAEVRARMQEALDDLRAERRFPVLG